MNTKQTDDELHHRLATRGDLAILETVAEAAIDELQRGFLEPDQIAASRSIMAVDPQLVDDGTYFVVEAGGRVAGCGGWSYRASLYRADQSPDTPGAVLDPDREPAKVRAMYTHPAFARRGVGRLLLSLSESAAAAAGFRELELLATMAGVPLYEAYGFERVAPVTDTTTGVPIPLLTMRKRIDGSRGRSRGDTSCAVR